MQWQPLSEVLEWVLVNIARGQHDRDFDLAMAGPRDSPSRKLARKAVSNLLTRKGIDPEYPVQVTRPLGVTLPGFPEAS